MLDRAPGSFEGMLMEGQVLASRGSVWTRLFADNILAAAAGFTTGGLQARAQVASGASLRNQFSTSATLALAFIDLTGGAQDGAVANAIEIKLFGTDTSNQTLSARIWGISEGIGYNGNTPIKSWEPTLLAEILGTLSAVQGAAGTIMGATDFPCDTYALTSGGAVDVTLINSPSDIRGAMFRLDINGFDKLVIELDDGASAVSVNGMYRLLW